MATVAICLPRGPDFDRIRSLRELYDSRERLELEPEAAIPLPDLPADLDALKALLAAVEPFTIRFTGLATAPSGALVLAMAEPLPAALGGGGGGGGAALQVGGPDGAPAHASTPAFELAVEHVSVLQQHHRTGRRHVVWHVQLGSGEARYAEFGSEPVPMLPVSGTGTAACPRGETTLEALAADGRVSCEQRLQLRVPARALAWTPPGRTRVLIAADNSGSMAGSVWRQVQSALTHIAEQALVHEPGALALELVVYNSVARRVPLAAGSFAATIAGLRAQGRTDFGAAFAALGSALREPADFVETAVLFMTDGHDTSGKRVDPGELGALLPPGAVVHVLGFGGDHSYEFLDRLRVVGARAGTFSYAQGSDGPDALADKLTSLFDFAATTCTVRLDLPGFRFAESGASSAEVTLAVPDGGGDGGVAEAALWVALERGAASAPAEAELSVTAPSGEQLLLRVPLRCDDSRGARVLWSARLLEARAAALLAAHLDSAEDCGAAAAAARLQHAVRAVNVFGSGMHREQRLAVFEAVAAAQARLDSVFKLLADGASAASKARASDLRFQATFSRARRARRMDQRVLRNAGAEEATAQALARLPAVVDVAFDAEARDFFLCTLSQLDVRELLLEPGHDVLGFGLAVLRPECAVDDPTQLRVESVSSTLLSQSAFEDAVRFSVSVDGALKAQGGFAFERSVAVVGRAREPINSWLPLYVCAEHWERVRPKLQASLGLLVTLNPLGFAVEQLQVPLLVLGSMIAAGACRGERELRLLLALLRTCRAVARDFGQLPKIRERVRGFVASHAGRLRDEVSSVLVFVASLLVLPADEVPAGDAFWAAVAAESYRRGSRAVLHGFSAAAAERLVAGLAGVDGSGPPAQAEAESHALLDDEAPDKHLEAAAELVGRQLVGRAPGGVRHKLQAARASCDAWLARARADAEAAEPPKDRRAPVEVDEAAAEAAADAFERRIAGATYPAAPQLARLRRFVEAFRPLADGLDAHLDARGGLAGAEVLAPLQACAEGGGGGERLVDVLGGCPRARRAALVQAARFPSNKLARAASEGGLMHEVTGDAGAEAEAALDAAARLGDEREDAAREQRVAARVARAVNTALVRVRSVWGFCGLASLFYTGGRDRWFADLIALAQDPTAPMPLRADKVAVMLTGRFEGEPVIDRGNSWRPDGAHRAAFTAAIGSDAYLDIEVRLRGRVGWVYRVSDIPNRHGHCNSNPFAGHWS